MDSRTLLDSAKRFIPLAAAAGLALFVGGCMADSGEDENIGTDSESVQGGVHGGVVGTYDVSLADIGEHTGVHAGGPLFADGTVGGGGIQVRNNGDIVVGLYFTTWSWVVPDEVALICFDFEYLQGFSDTGSCPPDVEHCTGTECEEQPVTGNGAPLLIDFTGDGIHDAVIRLTLN
jgi:hypothetical protein